MASDNFARCLAFVLGDEGGNSDDPADHGGRTSRGVTQRVYDAWCAKHDLPTGDVWLASSANIARVYFDEFWMPNCDPLPKGEDYLLFDMNTNMGPGEGTILLQRALGVRADGVFGPATKRAAMEADVNNLVPQVTAQKIAFYEELVREYPTDSKFYQGWLNRVRAVQSRIPSIEARALKMMRT